MGSLFSFRSSGPQPVCTAWHRSDLKTEARLPLTLSAGRAGPGWSGTDRAQPGHAIVTAPGLSTLCIGARVNRASRSNVGVLSLFSRPRPLLIVTRKPIIGNWFRYHIGQDSADRFLDWTHIIFSLEVAFPVLSDLPITIRKSGQRKSNLPSPSLMSLTPRKQLLPPKSRNSNKRRTRAVNLNSRTTSSVPRPFVSGVRNRATNIWELTQWLAFKICGYRTLIHICW